MSLVIAPQGSGHVFLLLDGGAGLPTDTIFSTTEFVANPRWSPSGEEVGATVGHSVVAISPGGTSRTLVAGSENIAYYFGGWSPDGHSIVYSDLNSIFVKNLETGRVSQVLHGTEEDGFAYPDWSADGNWLVFLHGVGGRLGVEVSTPFGRSRTVVVEGCSSCDVGFPVWIP